MAWARQSYERYSHACREGLRVLGCEPMAAPHCGPVDGLAARFGQIVRKIEQYRTRRTLTASVLPLLEHYPSEICAPVF